MLCLPFKFLLLYLLFWFLKIRWFTHKRTMLPEKSSHASASAFLPYPPWTPLRHCWGRELSVFRKKNAPYILTIETSVVLTSQPAGYSLTYSSYQIRQGVNHWQKPQAPCCVFSVQVRLCSELLHRRLMWVTSILYSKECLAASVPRTNESPQSFSRRGIQQHKCVRELLLSLTIHFFFF